ncbi:MAG: type III-B CRISPR module RAMP protein Cmr6 [Gammaproteobacteria bacterium]|nr:type III-B CRISPR module RAMP protein Cmr6 [Gammaproteobacteria bacterium]
MPLPLYQALHQNTGLRFDTRGHSGLWFERFYNAYPPQIKARDEYSKKEKEVLLENESEWLKAFEKHNSQIGDSEALKRQAIRQAVLTKALQGKTLVCKTSWHFVTGMGLPHPLENGLTWHPTLGVPYLTGAAIKGIVRTWLETWDKEATDEKQRARLRRWFGSEFKTPDDLKAAKKQQDFIEQDNQTGYLSFFDAFPIDSPKLGLDIITPHMGKWYADGGEVRNAKTESDKIPADWHDPVPVKFLVIKDAKFLFSVAPRNKKCANELDIEEVQEALQNALIWLGAGAKTAVGYGALQADIKEQRRIENEVKKYLSASKKPVDIPINTDNLSASEKVLHKFRQQLKTVQQDGYDSKWQYDVLVKSSREFIENMLPFEQQDREQAVQLLHEFFNTIGWHQPKLTGSKNKKKRIKQKAKKEVELKKLD